MNDAEFRAWLDGSNLTQQDAADLLGVARMSVSRWAKGERAVPDKIVAAIAALEIGRGVDAALGITARITEHTPGHIANSTPDPVVGDIVRPAPPHGGPWMQVRWIENGLFNCWWAQDDVRYAADFSRSDLETLYEDRMAAGITWPSQYAVPVVAMPISEFKAKPPRPAKHEAGTYRFGHLQAE